MTYVNATRFEYTHEQSRLMDTRYSLLEAMAHSRPVINEVPISPSISFRRNVWGSGDFYNGVNSQPLSYDDLESKIPIEQVILAMDTHINRLIKRKESAPVAG